MFSIFRKKYPSVPVDFGFLKTDMHSHLLPGVDDGAPDMATSLELKKGLEDLGYLQFIATPHIMWDIYKNTPATINGALVQLQQEKVLSRWEKYKNDFISSDTFIETLYNDLTGKPGQLLKHN